MRTHHLLRNVHRQRRSRTSTVVHLSRLIRSRLQGVTETFWKFVTVRDAIETKHLARPTSTVTIGQSSERDAISTSVIEECKSFPKYPYVSVLLNTKFRLPYISSSSPSDVGSVHRFKDAVVPASVAKSSNSTCVTKASLDARTRELFHAITTAKSNMSCHLSVEELCKHLRKHPELKGLANKIGGARQLLLVQRLNRDPVVLEGLHEAIALLGHCRPPAGWGIRILSIDGGGLKGIMALEVLRRLEELTDRPVHTMFDYICGVSTGAVMTVLLGALKSSIGDCERLYKQIGTAIFTQNPIWGAGKLVLSHAFYDTANWSKLIREYVGRKTLIETRRDPDCPLIAAVSAVVNRPRLQAFVFRNYAHAVRVHSQYLGTHTAHLWESIRASAAAPGYFEEYQLGEDVHQDGGILVNNPTALAIHECKLLWPGEQLQCVVSIGGGRYEPQPKRTGESPSEPSATGLRMKIMKIVDSATDTEAVHTTLHDLLPPTVYFRVNPYITENIALNESRLEKIEQLQQDARMYLRRNDAKMKLIADMLTQPRTRVQSFRHILAEKRTEFFG